MLNETEHGVIGINIGILPNPVLPADFMPKAITTALITNLDSKALTKLGEKLVKSNDGELESRIRKQVEEFMAEKWTTIDHHFSFNSHKESRRHKKLLASSMLCI